MLHLAMSPHGTDECHAGRAYQLRRPPLAKIRPDQSGTGWGLRLSGTALFEFRSVTANISKLFGPLEKPPLAALPFFRGC